MTTNKRANPNLKKLEDAQEDFLKMMQQVEPFLKQPKPITTSTAGKWQQTSKLLERNHFVVSKFK